MNEKIPYEQLEQQLAVLTREVEALKAGRHALQQQPGSANSPVAGRISEEDTPQYKLVFHQIITRLSSKFVEIDSDADATIDAALLAIGEYADMDRAYLFQIHATGRCFDNTHEWCAHGIAPQIQKLQAVDVEKELPWFWECMKANEIFNVPDVFNLPPEAALEKVHFGIPGIKSLLVVPICRQGQFTGFLGFDSVRSAKIWPDDIVYLLRVASQIIGNALEAKISQEALKASNELNYKLIETIPDVVIRTDLDGRILYCNEVVLLIGGYRREEVEGKNIIDFVAPEDQERAIENTMHMFEGRLGPKEYHLITKDGRKLLFEVNGDVLRYEDGTPFGTVVVCRNHSERDLLVREREQLKERLRRAEKLEAIGTLAGGIAHEFNNVLSIILGNTEMAMDGIPDWSPGKYNLQEVRSASLRASDIVRQLLSFSRKIEVHPELFDIVPTVKDTLAFLRSYILSPVEIRFGLSTESAFILGEATQINQVLINLCTNAADAMEEGGGVLAIRLDQVEVDAQAAAGNPEMGAGPHVQLSVSDTGYGMTPDSIEKIFDPYFTTKPVDKGSGMGLAVVHGIVSACGGSIMVESEPGKGTIVKVLFPLAKEGSFRAEPISDELPGGMEKILFVDDDESIAAVGRQMLERLGYRVETKTCPVEALALIRADPHRFDLVITDMAMPRMSGDLLSKKILKINSEIPIILCSGFSEKIDERRALAIGARMYLEKPFDTASLARKIRRVLDS